MKTTSYLIKKEGRLDSSKESEIFEYIKSSFEKLKLPEGAQEIVRPTVVKQESGLIRLQGYTMSPVDPPGINQGFGCIIGTIQKESGFGGKESLIIRTREDRIAGRVFGDVNTVIEEVIAKYEDRDPMFFN